MRNDGFAPRNAPHGELPSSETLMRAILRMRQMREQMLRMLDERADVTDPEWLQIRRNIDDHSSRGLLHLNKALEIAEMMEQDETDLADAA